MKNKFGLSTTAISFLVLFMVVIALRPLWATLVAGESPDIILKVNDLDKHVNILDDVFGSEGQSAGISISGLVRQMLLSTSWIDHSRAMVLGVVIKDPQPIAVALIPFLQPSEAFQSNYTAIAEADYYIVTVPPGESIVISNAFKAALNAASRSKTKYFITLEMGLRRLIEKNDRQIQQMISQAETLPQVEGLQQNHFKPQDFQQMMRNLLDIAAQLETLSINLEMSKEKFSLLTEAQAVSGTDLAKMFVSGAGAALLGKYRPAHQINFRTRSYDYAGLLGLFEKIFGNIYAKMGFDFTEIAAIMKHFNGEMAGGTTFGHDAIQFEGMYVLKDPMTAPNFAETVFLPWMEKVNQTVVQNMETRSGQKTEDIFIRTQESKVAGRNVYGVRWNIPAIPESDTQNGFPPQALMSDVEYRFTTVGPVLVIAHNDQQIGKLIKKAKTLKSAPAQGALMVMDIDLGGYIEFIRQTMPDAMPADQPIPKLGKLYFTTDFKDGQALSSSSIMTGDLKTIVAYASQKALGKTQAGIGPVEQKEAPSTGYKTGADNEQAAYWFKKGALCATYGNDRAAIKYYEKAIELDPDNSSAYFEQGLSYGQVGDYQKAIPLIDRAIRMQPQNGLYYYGRGRVSLLSGDKEKALKDFKKAVEYGDADAINYLKNIK